MMIDVNQPAILGLCPGRDGVVAWMTASHAESRLAPRLIAGKFGKRRFNVAGMANCLKPTRTT